MLVLRNIVKTEDTIESEYYPENKNVFGHIKIDINSKRIVSLKKAKGYEYSSGPLHAKNELLKMVNLEDMPKERVVIWY